MNVLGRIDKAPAEVRSYTILYGDDMDVGDTLTATAATVTFKPAPVMDNWCAGPPPGEGGAPVPPPVSASPMTVVYAVYTNDPVLGPFMKVMLSGGATGDTWIVTVTSTTHAGEVLVDTFIVKIK